MLEAFEGALPVVSEMFLLELYIRHLLLTLDLVRKKIVRRIFRQI